MEDHVISTVELSVSNYSYNMKILLVVTLIVVNKCLSYHLGNQNNFDLATSGDSPIKERSLSITGSNEAASWSIPPVSQNLESNQDNGPIASSLVNDNVQGQKNTQATSNDGGYLYETPTAPQNSLSQSGIYLRTSWSTPQQINQLAVLNKPYNGPIVLPPGYDNLGAPLPVQDTPEVAQDKALRLDALAKAGGAIYPAVQDLSSGSGVYNGASSGPQIDQNIRFNEPAVVPQGYNQLGRYLPPQGTPQIDQTNSGLLTPPPQTGGEISTVAQDVSTDSGAYQGPQNNQVPSVNTMTYSTGSGGYQGGSLGEQNNQIAAVNSNTFNSDTGAYQGASLGEQNNQLPSVNTMSTESSVYQGASLGDQNNQGVAINSNTYSVDSGTSSGPQNNQLPSVNTDSGLYQNAPTGPQNNQLPSVNTDSGLYQSAPTGPQNNQLPSVNTDSGLYQSAPTGPQNNQLPSVNTNAFSTGSGTYQGASLGDQNNQMGAVNPNTFSTGFGASQGTSLGEQNNQIGAVNANTFSTGFGGSQGTSLDGQNNQLPSVNTNIFGTGSQGTPLGGQNNQLAGVNPNSFSTGSVSYQGASSGPQNNQLPSVSSNTYTTGSGASQDTSLGGQNNQLTGVNPNSFSTGSVSYQGVLSSSQNNQLPSVNTNSFSTGSVSYQGVLSSSQNNQLPSVNPNSFSTGSVSYQGASSGPQNNQLPSVSSNTYTTGSGASQDTSLGGQNNQLAGVNPNSFSTGSVSYQGVLSSPQNNQLPSVNTNSFSTGSGASQGTFLSSIQAKQLAAANLKYDGPIVLPPGYDELGAPLPVLDTPEVAQAKAAILRALLKAGGAIYPAVHQTSMSSGSDEGSSGSEQQNNQYASDNTKFNGPSALAPQFNMNRSTLSQLNGLQLAAGAGGISNPTQYNLPSVLNDYQRAIQARQIAAANNKYYGPIAIPPGYDETGAPLPVLDTPEVAQAKAIYNRVYAKALANLVAKGLNEKDQKNW